jgi:uncharacterized protein (TIGR03435 family)
MTSRIQLTPNLGKQMLLVAAVMVGTSGTLVDQAKAQPQAPLAFEVASVRQHPLERGFLRRFPTDKIQCPGVGHCGISGSRFTDDVASLNDLIMDAYHVKPYQVTGLPDWGDSGHDIYDVNAKVEGDRTPTLDEVRRMLQTLLADRFQLKLHHETKDLPVYALVIAKNGPKLTPATGSACPGDGRGPGGNNGDGGGRRGGGGGGRGDDAEFAFLRSWEHIPTILAGRAGRPVVDKTGLTGNYCTLDGQDPMRSLMSALGPGGGRGRGDQPPSVSPNADLDGPSVFTLVEEKWGMKLEPQKGPVDILVIDHVERPSEN